MPTGTIEMMISGEQPATPASGKRWTSANLVSGQIPVLVRTCHEVAGEGRWAVGSGRLVVLDCIGLVIFWIQTCGRTRLTDTVTQEWTPKRAFSRKLIQNRTAAILRGTVASTWNAVQRWQDLAVFQRDAKLENFDKV